MPGRFKDELQFALNKFDLARSETLLDKLYEAESSGYVLTTAEEKLLARLNKCIESFKRTMYSLE
jgi:hypothetical protein